jgi:response regulator RpfG family c-di-GMP phosphodiesterase
MTRHVSGGKITTVLFVDDEAQWLEAVKMAVRDKKFKIITADSGEAALAKLRRSTPDLILSDVRMPDMNGFDLFEKVKLNPKLRAIPYVFMSSIDDLDAKTTARQLGADGYVEKPFDSDEVSHVVNELLGKFHVKHPGPGR